MLCFAFILSCFIIPRFECATLEDNIYFEFNDDPFAPSIEAIAGTNSIMFYTGANFDIACTAIIIDLNNGTIYYRVAGSGGGVNDILAFNQGAWVDNAYAKIIQTKTFNVGETSQTISDALYTWLYDAANVLTLYEFDRYYKFNTTLTGFNDIVTDRDISVIIGSRNSNIKRFKYKSIEYELILINFRYGTPYYIAFYNWTDTNYNELGDYITIYNNYIWENTEYFEIINDDNMEFSITNGVVEDEDIYLWFLSNIRKTQENNFYNSIGGFYNVIENPSFSSTGTYNITGVYNNLPFNYITFYDNEMYVEMISNNNVISSYQIEYGNILYFNYQSIEFVVYNDLLNNGVFTNNSDFENNSTFASFIQLVYTFIDIPLYYIRNILNINILSISLQTIVYSILSIGILIWLIKQVVGLNSIGGK